MIDQSYFDALVNRSCERLSANETLLCTLDAESTDFIRLNHAVVRQAGSIDQANIGLQLIAGQTSTNASTSLTGVLADDEARMTLVLETLRGQLTHLGPDPHLLFCTDGLSSEHVAHGAVPASGDALGSIQAAAAGRDLVGVYAAGRKVSGFANSLGQRNWFETSTFNFDWTFYLGDSAVRDSAVRDKAAKNGYAGFDWNETEFLSKVATSNTHLNALARPSIAQPPNEYRTYLAPAAVRELVDLVSWGGFGMHSHQTKQTPLLRMVEADASLAPQVSLREDTRNGAAPNFQEQGFARPDEVVLIEAGRYRDTLVSPRSAKEFNAATNGASADEEPQSLAIDPGSADTKTALERLGTGLYVGNLWYTNFSDRPACRVTGMTRFATFWVEDGELVAPVDVLRFDDSIYNMLGTRLIELDDTAEVILDASSYEHRSNASVRVPGALVDGMRFTL